MTDPIVVLALVAVGVQGEPASSAMVATAKQVLGPNAAILLEEVSALPADDDALAMARRVQAGAVVELSWLDTAHTRADLRIHTARGPAWAERIVDLPPNELAAEYGRTLGFAAASMITTLGVSSTDPPPDAPAAPLVGTSPSAKSLAEVAPAPADTSPPALSVHTPQDRASAAPTSPDSVTPAASSAGAGPPVHAFRYDLESAGVASVGTDAGSISLGAELRADAWLTRHMAAGFRTEARFGSMDVAQATYMLLQLGGGLSWRTLAVPGAMPLELDTRIDLAAADVVATRSGETRSRWVPEGALALEIVWFVLAPLGVLVTAGADTMMGKTAIAVGNDTVATVPLVRATAAIGVRVRF